MISAVVVNWNGERYLEGCLGALLAQDPPPDEVLLVDNQSEDGSVALVKARFPAVRVIDVGHNAGPGYARNLGAQSARHDRVLLLDNDVVLRPGVLQSLVRTMEADPGAVLVQARSVCASDPSLVHYDASDIHYLGLLELHNWFAPLATARPPAPQNGGLVALCFLADRPRLLDAGGFNADLFLLFEDTDLAWRLRMRGGRILLDPEAIVEHGSGTEHISMRGPHARYPARRVFLHSRNRWLVLLTCLHWRSLVLLAPAQFCYGAVLLVFACAKGHPIAWLHGKLDQLRLLPRLVRWRRLAQSARRVADRDLLVGDHLTLNPGLADRGARRLLHRALESSFAFYWKLLRGLCG
ncbi:MAG: glycosyltransferase family 2 protein [Planctomycetes bacterium]|nr:glycosyltransferase family 2 protein [Planctomycetota bacterium]